MTWSDRAACIGADPELFFPDHSDVPWEALHYCFACPVANECLDHAITHGERHGVWGGMTAGGREKYRQRVTA